MHQQLNLVLLLSIIVVGAQASRDPTPFGCEVCSVVADYVLVNPNVSSEIEFLLDKFCALLPPAMQEECETIVKRLATVIQKLDDALRLQEELTGYAVCTMLNYCSMDCCISDAPEQVHLSFMEDPHTMVGVAWVTRGNLVAYVRYGTDKTNLNLVTQGTSKTYTENAWLGWIHFVKLTQLTPGTRYYYQVGSDPLSPNGWSSIFSFVTEASDSQNRILRVAELGDMGADPEAQNTIKQLQQLVQGGQIDFIVHDGDISYADGYQHRWDLYMRSMEPVFANMQYMTTPGNHEVGVIGALNLSLGYIERFLLPGQNAISTDLSNMYYSWNYGNTHFIALDTENIYDTAEMTAQQTAWLNNDLSSLDRKRYPWVIVFGHRPFYCSNPDTDCEGFAAFLRAEVESLFNKYNVDLVLTAHKHNYERTWPIKPVGVPVKTYINPGAPVYIVNGAGGNREGVDRSHQPNDWSQVYIAEWGYLMITVYNQTTMDVDFHNSETNQIMDHFTLRKGL